MGHWYDNSGKPCYQVRAKNGKDRNTTLADAKKLSLSPSVTTITSILDKEALTTYFIKNAIKSTLEEERRRKEESWDKYCHRVIYASKKEGRDAAEKGNLIHNELESYFIDQYQTQEGAKANCYVLPTISLIQEIFGYTHSWIPEASFTAVEGFGGKVDLHSKELNVILDFKTKYKEELKINVYPTHLMQLAAYRKGLAMPTATCYNLFISSLKPGVLQLVKYEEKDIERAERMFLSLLEYWKVVNKYDSSLNKNFLEVT